MKPGKLSNSFELSKMIEVISEDRLGWMRYRNGISIVSLKISRSLIMDVPTPDPKLYISDEVMSCIEFVIRNAISSTYI